MVIAAFGFLLTASACATRTVGMQAPLAHDYDGIQWRPLDAPVSQRIIVAPGYTAVVENDPRTDPETLVERILRLPDDVRSARMEEIRLAVRPSTEGSFERELDIELVIVDGVDAPLIWSYEDIRFDDDWAVIEIPQHIWAGEIVEIQVNAGSGWEYGITVDRAPYGGEVALLGVDPQPLRGALGFQTVFSQSTDRSRLIEESVWPSLRSAATDPFLVILYAMIAGAGSVILWLRWREMGEA